MDNLNIDRCNWPMLLDMTTDECKQSLRALELSTYSKIVSVLRAQGELTKEKRKLLSDLQSFFSIPLERHRAEIRRAVNDEILYTIAERLAGPNTGIEWAIEGRRLIPLMPRVPPQVAYTALATRMAQIYCGLNAKNVKPYETAMYGKLDDVGADTDLTDSEDETEGLRFLPGSMIPQQYNADQGSYSTLPLSQARITMENIKEKENEIMEDVKCNDNDTTSSDDPPSLPSSPTPTSSPGPPSGSIHGYVGMTTQEVSAPIVRAEKRKRKRSFSTNHAPPHPPPPPPAIISPDVTQASALLAKPHIHTVNAPIRQHPNLGSALGSSSMKITVTGGITRSTTVPITSLSSHTPKVILVSTSAASGQSVNVYQRSISVPILKPNTQGGYVGGPLIGAAAGASHVVNSGSIHRGVSQALPVSASTVLCSSSPFVNKIRPRFASMTSSILSQGSSSLSGIPPRPPSRQRSNSLILQSDAISPTCKTADGLIARPQNAPTIIGQTVYPDSSSGGSLNILGPLQLRSGVTSIGSKSSIHLKQEGNKVPVIAQSIVPSSGVSGNITSVVGGRVIGRTSSASQGLYVVSTSSGTITVVTRTVASGSITSPRVVTVNTINNSRPSIVRGPAPTTIVSVGMNQKSIPVRQTTGIRPVIAGPRSNVIVVHKGSMSSGARAVGIQGIRDISAKIIAKPLPSGLSSSSNIPSGLLAGTLVVKPSASGKTVTCVTSSKKDANSTSGNMICSSSNQSSEISAVNSNVIVLDFTHGGSTSGSPSSTTALANLLHASRVTSSSSTSSNSSIIIRNEDATEPGNHIRRDTLITGSVSHDISTVSASSSLPTTRNARPLNQNIQELSSSSNAGDDKTVDETISADFSLPSHISSSLPSNIQRQDCDFIDLPESSVVINNALQEVKRSSSSLSKIVGNVENEWLKLLEEDEIPEDTERSIDNNENNEDDDEKSLLTGDSADNDTDVEDSVSKSFMKDDKERPMKEKRENEMQEDEEGDSMIEVLGDKSISDGNTESSTEFKEISASGSSIKEGNLQMLVETAVGSSFYQERTNFSNDAFQLFDSNMVQEHDNEESFCVTSIVGNSAGGVSSSSSTICHEQVTQSSSTPLQDEVSLGGLSELDPSTGYFCGPSLGENSSEEPTSNKAESVSDIEESEFLTVPEVSETIKEPE